MITRNAYILTTNVVSDRAQFSKTILETIGFNVRLIACIPNNNKVLSNKISMQYIYKLILESGDDYAYVFEDDINCLETIYLDEIIKYEQYSPIFFYLGICENNNKNSKYTNIIINNHPVYSKSGNVRGLHAVGISKKGAEELLDFSKKTNEDYMDIILEEFSIKYPANIVRYDLSSYIKGHRGIIFQDRERFPSVIS